jgi:hypothetical protein
MAVLFTNNATTNLASSISSSATSLTVAAGTGSLFPNPTAPNYFIITLIGITGSPIEIVKCTARSTDTLTIVRAQEGTTASAFTGGDQVQLRITAGEMNDIETNLDSLNTSVSTINSTISGLNPVAGGVVYENGQTITSNYTMTTNKNGMSAGPITIDTGITVTIPTDSTWVIV